MNFAMMFAIALGIDYALFIVVRFRSALAAGLAPRDATALTMATAGKAVLMSGLTVIAALLAVTLVPVPAFRSVPLGIALAVMMVLAATLTLLPAVLSRLGHRINGGRVRVRGGDRPSQRALRRVGPAPVGAAAPVRRRGGRDPAASRRACARAADRDADRRGAPARCRLARGATAPPAGVRGRRRECSADRGLRPGRARPRDRRSIATAGIAGSRPPSGRAAMCCSPRSPRPARVAPSCGRRSTASAASCPPARCSAAPPPRPATSSARSSSRLPVVVGVVLGLGFMLLLALLRAPLAAAAAVALSLARDRRRVRRRAAGVPGGSARAAPRLGVAGLRRRVGADLLLRARLRAGDGLHGVSPGHGQGGPRPHGRRAACARRGTGRHGARDQRRRCGDGRGLHDVRALGPDRAQGDGRHPRRRGAARRHADPAPAPAGRAAPARRARMVDAGLARPPGPECRLSHARPGTGAGRAVAERREGW